LYPTGQIARDRPNRHAAGVMERGGVPVFARFEITPLAQRLPRRAAP